GRVGPAHIGGDPGQAVDEIEAFDRVGPVGGGDAQAFGGEPRVAVRAGPGRRQVEGDLREVGEAHRAAPSASNGAAKRIRVSGTQASPPPSIAGAETGSAAA